MPHAERTIVIGRPLDEVFAFFADGENDPRWRPAVKVMRREGPLAVGVRYTHTALGMGRRAALSALMGARLLLTARCGEKETRS